MDDVLFCVVCGFERGGTTLVAELIRQYPDVDGRFECGFLLVDRLSDFAALEPFASNLKAGWGLSAEDFEYILQAPSHRAAYQRLRERSNLPNKNVRIYDKTPRYMLHLPSVLKKTEAPCVCVVRDPRALYWSQQKYFDRERIHGRYEYIARFLMRYVSPALLRQLLERHLEKRRAKLWLRGFCINYLQYAAAWKAANQMFPGRILLISHEKLCLSPLEETQKIYDFLGLEFKAAYLDFRKTPDPYVNRGGIRADLIHEYRQGLSSRDQNYLLKHTKAFSAWHWVEK